MAAAATYPPIQPEYDYVANKVKTDLETIPTDRLRKLLGDQEDARKKLFAGEGFTTPEAVLIYLFHRHAGSPFVYTSKIADQEKRMQNLVAELKAKNEGKYNELIEMINAKGLVNETTTGGRRRKHTRRHKKSRKHTRRQRQRQRQRA